MVVSCILTVIDVIVAIFAIPVMYIRKTVGTNIPPFIFIVLTAKGSEVWTIFVTLNSFARPPGAAILSSLKISGRRGNDGDITFHLCSVVINDHGIHSSRDLAGDSRRHDKFDMVPANRFQSHMRLHLSSS